VQQSDGSWLHYADADNVPSVLATRVRVARNNVAGNTAGRILATATGIEQTTQPDGTTVYTGTIPNSSVDPDTLLTPSDDLLMWAILSHRLGGPGDPAMRLRMTAGSDGTVREVDLTRGDTLKFTYTDLGSTPSITPLRTPPRWRRTRCRPTSRTAARCSPRSSGYSPRHSGARLSSEERRLYLTG
jgi:hypothetical protein